MGLKNHSLRLFYYWRQIMENQRRNFLQIMSIASIGVAASALPVKAEEKAKTMDALTALKTRHSVRSYTADPVSEEDLQLVLEAAMQAPSALNEQPWELVVIRNPETLEKVAEISKGAAFASKAPLAIMVCLNKGKEKISGIGIIDVNLCAENILLAAHALGLGAVYTGVYPSKELMKNFQDLLELPKNVLPIGLIVMGHPKLDIKKVENRFNKTAVHQEKWQG